MDLKGLNQKAECIWELPLKGSMQVPGRIFGSRDLILNMDEKVKEQISNVAALPGIVKASLAMPDAHWGYGFPIGGVAGFDPDAGGIISVGGVGYDISCGVRSMTTNLCKEEVEPLLENLIDHLFKVIPAGVGSKGHIDLSQNKLDEVLVQGACWAVAEGYGSIKDLEYIEENGCLQGADPGKVSSTAKKRQQKQMGTLGSGNHYLEIQYVDEIYDHFTADAFGFKENDVLLSLHCGSRALGHQIGTDYIQLLGQAARKYKLQIPERDLVCAPINSPEGRDYYAAMACGVNCALANRQILGHLAAKAFAEVFAQARLGLIYDVSHNTCKIEEHELKPGLQKEIYVHRKGATRAFGPGRKEIPERYFKTGQPVIIGGTMGTYSFLLAGNETGQELAWGSACHGAGRAMSRRQAQKHWKGKKIVHELAAKGILLRTTSLRGAAEEAPHAYKDVADVVEATHQAKLARKVARLRPMACIKG